MLHVTYSKSFSFRVIGLCLSNLKGSKDKICKNVVNELQLCSKFYHVHV